MLDVVFFISKVVSFVSLFFFLGVELPKSMFGGGLECLLVFYCECLC